MDVKLDCCGDHFVIYASIELSYYIPETNIMLYVKLYLNLKKFQNEHTKTHIFLKYFIKTNL